MKRCMVPLLLALAACASAPQPPGRRLTTERHELAMADLVQVCTKGDSTAEPGLNGCFEWIGDVCHIYTLSRWVREMRDGDLAGYHRTLGHELDHCQIGLFHGQARGVFLPRVPTRWGIIQ